MRIYRFTPYFDLSVLAKRPYRGREWCIAVVSNPIRRELRSDGRWRFWGLVPEIAPHYLRVVTLEDGVTIQNAFPDRGFRP